MTCPVGGIICPVGPVFQGGNPGPPCGVWYIACGIGVAPPPGGGAVVSVPVCAHAVAPGSMAGALDCVVARLAAISRSIFEILVLSVIVRLKICLSILLLCRFSGPACLSFPFLCDSVVPPKLLLHVFPR